MGKEQKIWSWVKSSDSNGEIINHEQNGTDFLREVVSIGESLESNILHSTRTAEISKVHQWRGMAGCPMTRVMDSYDTRQHRVATLMYIDSDGSNRGEPIFTEVHTDTKGRFSNLDSKFYLGDSTQELTESEVYQVLQKYKDGFEVTNQKGGKK